MINNLISSAASLAADPAQAVSLVRSAALPVGGVVDTIVETATAFLGGGEDFSLDWRVRLSVPPKFLSSAILAPLAASDGNLIFPYTPAIQISGSANYDEQAVTHQNYQFTFYQSSRAEQIVISAPFNVEDTDQARYWIAAVHFLRSATKMFTGEDADAGNPPPLLKLNGYGDHVFKNVPVVVKSFSFDLPSDADYINVNIIGITGSSGSSLGAIGDIASEVGGIAGAVGGAAANLGLGSIADAASSVIDAVNAVGTVESVVDLLSGDASVAGGINRVPTKSTLNVTLQPVYSRNSAKKFSLTKFVNGEYMGKGYV